MDSIDHIVWAVPDLDSGCQLFEEKTGIRPTFGGYHTTQGTKNALVKMGQKAYFEILAPDPDSPIQEKRWMGIDLIEAPRITRIAYSTDQIDKKATLLHAYNSHLGQISKGERQTNDGGFIRWMMTLPYHAPVIDLAPFYIDWSDSPAYPSDMLEEQNISIEEIRLISQEPSKIKSLYQELQLNVDPISIGSEAICVCLNSPKGKVSFT